MFARGRPGHLQQAQAQQPPPPPRGPLQGFPPQGFPQQGFPLQAHGGLSAPFQGGFGGAAPPPPQPPQQHAMPGANFGGAARGFGGQQARFPLFGNTRAIRYLHGKQAIDFIEPVQLRETRLGSKHCSEPAVLPPPLPL